MQITLPQSNISANGVFSTGIQRYPKILSETGTANRRNRYTAAPISESSQSPTRKKTEKASPAAPL